MNESNKKKGLIAGAAAIFVAATLAVFGISGDTIVEVDYSLTTENNLSELSLTPPEEASVDIVELYCNGELVTKAVLPDGTLKSIPFVFSDLSNLELRLYRLNEVIGIGKFEDDKLYVAFKDDVIKGSKELEEGETDAEE